MREITTHQTNECNSAIAIAAAEADPKTGGCHEYMLTIAADHGRARDTLLLRFQNGPIQEVGVNGITNEALLAVLIDRLEGFQAGPFACAENAEALAMLREAQHWLKARTMSRQERGVEGTHEV